MACFLVPAAEAVATRIIIRKEEKNVSSDAVNSDGNIKIPFSRKVKWLSNMLWGGSALLAFEHVWHGEIVPWFPFLTATGNSADFSTMVHEMATSGVGMAVLVTAVWFGMTAVTGSMERKLLKERAAEKRGTIQ